MITTDSRVNRPATGGLCARLAHENRTRIGIYIVIGVLIGGALQLGLLSAAQGQAGKPDETARLIHSVEGPALYKAYCAVCHGIDGRGRGPLAASLKTPPSDLTRIARSSGGFPSARIERIISGEEPAAAGHGPRDMPVWGPVFSQIAWDQDLGRIRIHNLAKYLEAIQER